MLLKRVIYVLCLLAGVAIGIVCARIWTALLPRPGPATTETTITPPASGQKPDVVIHGRASGPAKKAEARRRPQETRTAPGEGNRTIPQAYVESTPAPVAQAAPPAEIEPAFSVGDRAEGTIEGAIEVVNQHGRKLTTEPVPITGTYSVEFPAPGEALVELEFDAPAMVSIKEPEHAVHLGASAGWIADEPVLTLHAEYEWRREIVGGLEAQAEFEAGWAWTPENDGPYGRAEIGIVYRF